MSTEFGVDSSSRLSFRPRTHKVTDAIRHPTHDLASANVGKLEVI